jgi:NTP pyrophosphatase (non-canonical NTP hydrolase)
VDLAEFQDTIRRTYFERDSRRGVDGNFRWMVEEVGELAKAIRHPDPDELTHEVGDVLAWLTSVANLMDVDLERAADRYARGCPRCGNIPCTCPMQ